MSIATPLFFTDLDTLKARLRMSSSGDGGTDAGEILQAALEEARVGFYTELGSDRIAAILTGEITTSATTQPQLDRLMACACEVAWVKLLMLESPNGGVYFQDSMAGARHAFQDEGALRAASYNELRKMTNDARTKVDRLLAYLRDGPEADSGGFNCDTIGPSTEQPRPGQSVLVGDGLGVE